jgi:hypothetical protein
MQQDTKEQQKESGSRKAHHFKNNYRLEGIQHLPHHFTPQ